MCPKLLLRLTSPSHLLQMVMLRNEVCDCRASGVFLRLSAQGLIAENNIHSNGEAGLDIRKGANPIIVVSAASLCSHMRGDIFFFFRLCFSLHLLKWVFMLPSHSVTRYTADCDQGLLFLAMEKVLSGVTRSIIIRRRVSIFSSVGIHMSGRSDSTLFLAGCLIADQILPTYKQAQWFYFFLILGVLLTQLNGVLLLHHFV